MIYLKYCVIIALALLKGRILIGDMRRSNTQEEKIKMKKTLKTVFAMMLAAMIAVMPFMSIAYAAGEALTISVDYYSTYEFMAGREYVIVGSNGSGSNFALSASSVGNGVFSTPVEIVNGVITGQLDECCVWTAVIVDGSIYLCNNQTGKYLGSLFNICTWDNINAADSVCFSRSGLSLNYNGMSKYLNLDAATNSFTLSNEMAPWNVGLFFEHETSILLTPFVG